MLPIFCQFQGKLALYAFACLLSNYLLEYLESLILFTTPKYSIPCIIIDSQSSTGNLIYSPTHKERPIKISHFAIEMTWNTKSSIAQLPMHANSI